MNRSLLTIVAVCWALVLFAIHAFATEKTDNIQPSPQTSAKAAEPAVADSAAPRLMLRLTRAVSTMRSGEQILWQVVSSGGTDGASPGNRLVGTIGQTAVGQGSSTNYRLNQGYWQDFSAGGVCCLGPIRGNVDYDPSDNIDISDLVYLVDYMFASGPAPVCMEEADLDATGGIDISDLVYLVDYMFTSGPPPLAC